jgi:lysophospholipase L1-like esterase
MNMNANDIRICFIGDSYVQGTGDPECLGWVGRLCASARHAGHNITAYNLGVRRETSRDIAHRWLSECERRLPATTDNYVVFSFGANDVTIEDGAPRVAEHETLASLRAILETAKAHYRALLVGPPATSETPHNARLGRLSGHMKDAAEQMGVPYLDLFSLLVNDVQWMEEVRSNDGAHPKAPGYEHIANIVAASGVWWFGKQ